MSYDFNCALCRAAADIWRPTVRQAEGWTALAPGVVLIRPQIDGLVWVAGRYLLSKSAYSPCSIPSRFLLALSRDRFSLPECPWSLDFRCSEDREGKKKNYRLLDPTRCCFLSPFHLASTYLVIVAYIFLILHSLCASPCTVSTDQQANFRDFPAASVIPPRFSPEKPPPPAF